MVTRHKDAEDIPVDASGAFPVPRDWWLEDAEDQHADHPRSFFIPCDERRRRLRAGELVRLGFVYGPHADRDHEGHHERMWVEVLEQHVDGHAHGQLRNRPPRLSALTIGDLVAFEPEHVLGIDYTDEELGYSQDQWPVVDRAILDDDRPPDVVVRAPGPYTADADEWWMLVRENAAGPTTENVNRLTDMFPGLEEPLRARDGLWALVNENSAAPSWRRISDEEAANSPDWRSLMSWLADTAAAMRSQSSESGGPGE